VSERPATILVVEDNPITRKLFRVALEIEGYHVLEAPDGRTALELAETHTPALAILDLLLPDIDGIELCRRLRATPAGREMPILACSGLQSKLEEARSLQAGFTDLLFKPVEPSRLVEAMRTHLHQRAAKGKSGRKRRILLVDDDPVQRKLNKLQLEQVGFHVAVATDGLDALAQAGKAPPDAIACDVLMPRMNGMQLSIAIRQDPRLAHVPIVLTSSTLQHIEDADRRMAQDLGANTIVPRTPGLDEVIAELLAALEAPPPPLKVGAQALAPDHLDRFLRQVEMQAALNANMAQRAALDAALLAISTSTASVLTRKLDLQDVLDQVLAHALDAGGVSVGAVYLLEPEGSLRVRAQLGQARGDEGLADFYGHADLLRRIMDQGRPVQYTADQSDAEARELVAKAGVSSLAAAPLVAAGEPLGVLVMMTGRRKLEGAWLASIGAVATQLALAVALSRTLAAHAERAHLAELNADVTAALVQGNTLRDTLQPCAEAFVRHLDAAFARIWILQEAEQVLELQASAGMYTHLDGPHSRVPVGQFKIGLIAKERTPHLTNQVIGDPRVHDQEWAKREGMVAFAGFPLIVHDRVVGVVAMFSRQPFTPFALQALASVAQGIALGIDRRRGEDAIRELSVAVDHGPASVLITDVDGRIRYVNERFTRITGYSAAEALGQTPRMLNSGATPEHVYRDLWTAIKSGREWRGEIQNRRKSGELFWNAVSISPIRDASGQIARFVGVQEDITARKQAEAALEDREQRFRQVVENIREVFFVVDAQFRETLYISPAYEEVWGRSCQSAYDDPSSFLEPVHPEDRVRLQASIARVQQGEDPGDEEFRVVRPDGGIVWVLGRSVPIRNAAGEVYRIAGVALDITERRRAEDALRANERRLRTLFETVNLIVLMLDANARVDYVNPYFLNLTGYTRDEAFGSNWVERFLPKAQQAELSGVFRELLERDVHPHYRNPIVTKAGEERTISWHNTVLRDAQGRPTGTLSIGEDITEHQRLEEQFRQAQKMEAVGRLAGGVAHDFNNLLTVITSYSTLLLDDMGAADPRREDLEEIRKAAAGAAGLTRQLLAFSRQQVLEPRVLDLNAVVAGAGKMLQRLIGEDVALVTVLSPDLGSVKADPGQIEQVIMNLAVNARDAMPDGGKLTIETVNVELGETYTQEHRPVSPGPYVLLSVSDTGTGMDESTKAHLFEPFFTTKEQGRGTGLGLATVYGIVKQSGGFIWVYSEPSHGTTFKIYLPRVNEPAGDLQQGQPLESLRGTETILLAEDAAGVRAVAREVLKRNGYSVMEASDGRAALDLAASHSGPIHLLVTDVIMPEMSGRQLADRLREGRPELKVLFVSGYTDDAIIRHGILEPGIAFLQKPFTPDALARKVREVLQR
jgi:PAS domain S-box-containing protein